jgi:hypothetical protein
MSDARRRQLERDVARGDGEASARVALLRERLRAGELTGDRALLAAHLAGPADDDAWLRALGGLSDELALRAVLAAVRLSTAFAAATARPGGRSELGVMRDFGWRAAACQAEHLDDAGRRARSFASQQREFADRYGVGAGLALQVAACGCASAGLAALDAPPLLARLGDPLAVPWLADVSGLTAAFVRAELTRDLTWWALER